MGPRPKALSELAARQGGDWDLGVNFTGVSQLAGLLYGYIPQEEDVIEATNGSIKRLLKDGGWRGQAAEAFTDAWDDDGAMAARLSEFESAVADVLDRLASSLSWLQRAMDTRATEMGPPDPNAPPETGAGTIDPRERVREQYRKQAKKLQEEAAKKLVAMYAGKDGDFNLMKALHGLEKDKDVPSELKMPLAKTREDLRDGLPNDWWDDKSADSWGDAWGKYGKKGGVLIGGGIGWFGGKFFGDDKEGWVGAAGGALAGGEFGDTILGGAGWVFGGLFGDRGRND